MCICCLNSLLFKYAINGFAYNSKLIISVSTVQSLNELHVSFKVCVCVFVCLVDVQCLDVTVYVIVTDAFMVFIFQIKRKEGQRK